MPNNFEWEPFPQPKPTPREPDRMQMGGRVILLYFIAIGMMAWAFIFYYLSR